MAGLRKVIVGVSMAWACVMATGAPVQTGHAAAGPRIDGFDVEQVASLAPGTQINFSLFASPAATATLDIDGLGRSLEMRESSPGVYELAYVVEARDRLRADTRVVATIWRDGIASRAVLEETLVLDGPAAAPRRAAESPPDVEAVPPPPLPRGGTPVPATASVLIPFPIGGTWPVALAPAPAPAPVLAPARAAPVESPRCVDCARVESIRTIEAPGGAAIIGTAAGGVAGAIFGDRIGEAHARHVTRVLGAIGGALLGREVGKRAERRAVYEATLRLPNGALQVRRYDEAPPFRIGDTVHLDVGASAEARSRF